MDRFRKTVDKIKAIWLADSASEYLLHLKKGYYNIKLQKYISGPKGYKSKWAYLVIFEAYQTNFINKS